jgi:hypothetical protein
VPSSLADAAAWIIGLLALFIPLAEPANELS